MARWSLLLLFFAAGLAAQEPERPSHKPLDTDIGESGNPEELLARRLGGARANKGKLDELLLDKDVQELAKSLVKNGDFLRSLKNKIPPEELKALADRFKG